MADAVELVPVSEFDERVFESWSSGKSLRAVSREFGIPLSETERIIDRFLPSYDPPHSLRAFKREIERLESLASEVYSAGLRDKDPELIHLYARLNERLCVMRNWGAFTLRLDPVAAQATQQPSQHEKIRAALFRLAGRPVPPLADGNGNGNGENGAAGTLSDSSDGKPSL